MRIHVTPPARAHALSCFFLVLLGACGGDSVAGSGSETEEDVVDTGANLQPDRETVTIPEEDTREDGIPVDADDPTDAADSSVPDSVADTVDSTETADNGEPCAADVDCTSQLCVFLTAGTSTGVCTEPCFDSAGCEEGFDCVLLSNSGADASQVCIPRDYCYDPDGDTFGTGPGCNGRDCDESNPSTNVGADEVCDGVDNDCDGGVDNQPRDAGLPCDTGFSGICSEGVQVCEQGIVECRGARTPQAEVCDGVDNDCDGEVDEVTEETPVWFADLDEDRFGDPDVTIRACAQPAGYVALAGDCDDSAPGINPTATELCDSIDNNCNDEIDEPTAANATTWYADSDDDGQGDPDATTLACTQPAFFVADRRDCDDSRDDVFTGAPELCDGVDNDCDGTIDEDDAADAPLWYADTDDDGFGDPDDSLHACLAPTGYVDNADDCDDGRDTVYPDAPERCNGRDNNCDDEIDVGGSAADAPLWYFDADSDGFGDPTVSVQACLPPTPAWVDDSSDCDDTRDAINPDAIEVCDGVDNNCDGRIDPDDAASAPTWFRDEDEDTWGSPDTTSVSCAQPAGYVARSGDCNDGNGAVNPAATEVCDRVDNDCDSVIDPATSSGAPTWYRDADGDSFGDSDDSVVACFQPPERVSRAGDCDDDEDQINPEALEICDGVDNNCDMRVDPPGSLGELRFYRDQDIDGYGNPGSSLLACVQPTGYVANALDCNDSNIAINRDAVEVCDGVDNNCDGAIDESLTRSCYGGPAGTASVGSCRAGTQACSAGAWGACVGEVRPATDTCDGLDNDCDGTVDNIGVGVELTTYTTLNGAHESCDGVVERFSSQCNAAIHRSCSARECLASGFGALENDGDIAFVACVPGTLATVRQLQWPALTAIQPACDGTTEFFGLNCNSAIHRWCQSAGYSSGWGPVERDATNVFVACTSRSVQIATTFTALAAIQPGCNGSSSRFSLDCNSAIHRTCQAAGYSSGWGPVENSGDTAIISCLPLR